MGEAARCMKEEKGKSAWLGGRGKVLHGWEKQKHDASMKKEVDGRESNTMYEKKKREKRKNKCVTGRRRVGATGMRDLNTVHQ